MDRRFFLAGVAAVGAGVLGWQVWPAPPLAFDTAGVPEGYRRLIKDGNGGITAALSGVTLEPTRAALNGQALCHAAFERYPMQPGAVTIAGFMDYFCPYCRTLDETVRQLFDADPRVTQVWHQVPLLGRASQMAARGILAAAEQGASAALHRRLIRTSFVPNPAYLRDFAREAGIDEATFMADVQSDKTNAQLATSAAVFRAFGFVGTPGLVIGRTIVSGVITKRELQALVEQEIAAPAPAACG